MPIAFAEGLMTLALDALLGSRCSDCGHVTFPRTTGCPRCGSDNIVDMQLAREGTLWTWTSQEFRPISPPYAGTESAKEFQRYYVGYVELPGQLRVETRLTGYESRDPVIGEPVEFTTIPFGPAPDGETRLIPAFRPTPKESDHG